MQWHVRVCGRAFTFILVFFLSIGPRPATAADVVFPTGQGKSVVSLIRQVLAQRLSIAGALGDKHQRQALEKVYRARQFAPIFVDGNGWQPEAHRLIKRLAAAHYDGLNPADYFDKRFSTLDGTASLETKIEAELALARALTLYARHAMGGRVDLARLQPNVYAKRPEADFVALLTTIAASSNSLAVIEALHPSHPPFLSLRRELARLIDSGDTIQSAKNDVVINMERWRWLPRQLGASFIMVSLPEYMVRVVDKGALSYQGRVIVGEETTPTPLFSGEIQYIVVNPSWTVPPGVLKNEILPLYRKDPEALARKGLRAVYRRGGGVSFRQEPGEDNALGRIKFIFPNEYSIYLHDTPSRHLFANQSRALSHGCVRVDQPLKFAEAVFAREEGLSAKRIESLYGNSERHVRLKRRVPVHLTYFTLSTGADGRMTQNADIYGLDRKMKQVMGL